MGTRCSIQERLGVPRPAVKAGNEQCPAIIGTTFFPPHVGRLRELFWESLFRAGIGVKYFRTPLLTLVHDARVLELFDECFFPPFHVMSALATSDIQWTGTY